MRTFIAVALVATACSVASQRASADDQLQEVIVTATRTQRSIVDLPVSASIVSAADVQDTPSQTLDDVLRSVPGVNLPIQSGTQAHPTADNVSMRGLGGIHALVLLDGVPLNDPFFGYIQWGQVPLALIDRVEIVRGGGSPLWGNYAMGGVINVITRFPETDEFFADAAAGGFGTYRSSIYGAYSTGATNRIGVGASFQGTDGFMAVPAYARRDFDTPTSFDAQNFEIRDRWQPGDDWVVNARFNHHKNSQQLGTPLSTNDQTLSSYTGDVTRRFGPSSSLTVTAFYSSSTFETTNPTVNDSTLPPAEQTQHIDNVHTTPYHNLGGSVIWTQHLDGWVSSVVGGVDVNAIDGWDHAAIYDATGAHVRTDIGSGEQVLAGAFVEASIVPIKPLEVLLSGRLQYFEVLHSYDGNPGGPGAEPDQHLTKFDPRVSVRYALTPELGIRGAYYQAFRAPTLDNLYRGFASNGGIYYPNSNLKPETLSGGEVGIDFAVPDFRGQVTYYHTTVSNLITTASLPDSQLPPGFFYGGVLVNAASALAEGIEVEGTWKLGNGLSATVGYTWAQSIYRSNPTDPGSVGQQLVDVPRNLASLALQYENPSGWRVATNAQYISATAWANPDHTDPGFPYQASADTSFLVGLSGGYNIRPNVEAYAQIQNLFDRHLIVNPGPYNPPQYGTPFLAMVGVRATFK